MQISLAAARVNAEYSIEEAAKKLGISKKTLWNWENKKSFPSGRYISSICELYGMPMDVIKLSPND